MVIYSREEKTLIIPEGLGYDAEQQYNKGYDNGYGEGYPNGYNDGYTSGYTDGYASGYDYGRAGIQNLTLLFKINAQTQSPSVLRINGHNYEINHWEWRTSGWGGSTFKIEVDVEETAITECYFEAVHYDEVFEITDLTINGWETNITSVETVRLNDYMWSADVKIQPFSIDPFDMGYISGYTDGYNSASTEYQKRNYFNVTINGQMSPIVVFQDAYINGRKSPEATFEKYNGGVNISAYTPSNKLNTLEIDVRYFAMGAPWSAISGPVIINGINEVNIVSQSVTEERISDLGSTYRYVLNFNNVPIYDYESYQLGLSACQNNEEEQ